MKKNVIDSWRRCRVPIYIAVYGVREFILASVDYTNKQTILLQL